MGPLPSDQLKSILSRALALPEAEVTEYLERACAGNAPLRAQVEELLRRAMAETQPLAPAPTAVPHALELESVLAQRFVLKRFLGRGGMGEVYLAEDRELGGEVALKTVRGGLLDADGIARFKREVQLSRQVTHPNICRVFDVGREVVNGQELIFLTMEYLDGDTLAERLAKHGKMSEPQVAPLARQLAAGLAALHEKGIIHRDLKPQNVMLVGDRLSITDFGLARAFAGEGSDADYTQTGAILGTPGYMAPEQLLGERATPATDIYAMGLVLFEMLSGKKASLLSLPVPGQTGLPAPWEAAVLRCLERDPKDRPKSAVEALAGFGARRRAKPWALAAAMAIAGLTLAAWFNTKGPTALPAGKASVNEEILRARALLVRYYKPQNVLEAMRILEGVVAQRPTLALGHAELGAARFRLFVYNRDVKLLEQAKQACNRAIELDAETAAPHVTLGNIYLSAGRRDLARSELATALNQDARLAEVHFGLAQLYRAEGRRAEQEAAIQKAIDLAPEQWAYHSWRSSEYRDQGKYPEAFAELALAEKLMPDNPLVFNNKGILYLRTRNFAEARQAFERSNELEPRPRTLGNLGSTYYLEQKYVEAAAALKRAAEMEPTNYLAMANLAAALDRTPATKAEARAAYRKAIRLAEPLLAATPDSGRMLGNLASYHALLGDREQALALIRRAIALEPESPDVAQRATAVYEFLADREQALLWAGKALDLGYPREALLDDPELQGLTGDPRFQKRVAAARPRR